MSNDESIVKDTDLNQTYPDIDLRKMNLGPPASNNYIERRRSEQAQQDFLQEAIQEIVKEKEVHEAVRKAELERIAVREAKNNRMILWLSLGFSLFSTIYPVYSDYKNGSLDTNIQQYRISLDQHKNISDSNTARIAALEKAIQETQKEINSLRTESARHEAFLDVLRTQLLETRKNR